MSEVKEIESSFTEVLAKDMLLHCPTAAVAAWSSHPCGFLDISETEQVACPYCSTKHKLKAGEQTRHH
jgi:uncharacterized Zn-finger protein